MTRFMMDRMRGLRKDEGETIGPPETSLGQLNDERFAMMVDGHRLIMQQRGEVFDHFTKAFKKVKLARVLEIGTADGALMVGLRNLFPDADMLTVDIKTEPWYDEIFNTRRIGHRSHGYETDEVREFVTMPGTILVLCDGADKPGEFKYFAPLLKPGDFICAHDYLGFTEHLPWGTGCIKMEDVAAVCTEQHLTPFKPEVLGKVVWLGMRKEALPVTD